MIEDEAMLMITSAYVHQLITAAKSGHAPHAHAKPHEISRMKATTNGESEAIRRVQRFLAGAQP